MSGFKGFEACMDLPRGSWTEAGSIGVHRHTNYNTPAAHIKFSIGIAGQYANGRIMLSEAIPCWLPVWFTHSQFDYWHLVETR